MKKQYINPKTETVCLKLGDRLLDEKFGNKSGVIVNDDSGTSVSTMDSKEGFWDSNFPWSE